MVTPWHAPFAVLGAALDAEQTPAERPPRHVLLHGGSLLTLHHAVEGHHVRVGQACQRALLSVEVCQLLPPLRAVQDLRAQCLALAPPHHASERGRAASHPVNSINQEVQTGPW